MIRCEYEPSEGNEKRCHSTSQAHLELEEDLSEALVALLPVTTALFQAQPLQLMRHSVRHAGRMIAKWTNDSFSSGTTAHLFNSARIPSSDKIRSGRTTKSPCRISLHCLDKANMLFIANLLQGALTASLTPQLFITVLSLFKLSTVSLSVLS